MKLITEHTEEVEYIVEAKEDGSKNYVIEGIFAQAEQKNRNGRIYPKAILESAVSKYDKEQVRTQRAVGELNHPAGPIINLDKVSHRITELKWDGNNVMGKALILDASSMKWSRKCPLPVTRTIKSSIRWARFRRSWTAI